MTKSKKMKIKEGKEVAQQKSDKVDSCCGRRSRSRNRNRNRTEAVLYY
jgi:hypothetical protein